MSHLAIYIYNKNHNGKEKSEETLQNIKKAESHFYRGTLDYYKMFIRFSIGKVSKKDNILNSFYSIRKQEFLHLGENLMDKKIDFFNPDEKTIKNEHIIKCYKILFEAIIKEIESINPPTPNSQTPHS